MWTNDCNEGKLTAFMDELAKTESSSGDWKADYSNICSKFSVLPCPFITFDPATKSCRASNCDVDLASWRAAMIACALSNSPVGNLVAYNCRFQSQHLLDISGMLEKRFVFGAVKLDFIDWGDTVVSNDVIMAIGRLISANSTFNYLSLRGCSLQDSNIAAFLPSLIQSVYIRGLNLANNRITDIGLRSLINVLRCNISLEKISLKNNIIEGSGLIDLSDIVFGCPSTPEDDTSFKSISKNAADKNKTIKELNKKRKKAGEVELEEISVPERIVKPSKTESILINKQFKLLDISCGSVTAEYIEMINSRITSKRQEKPEVLFSLLTRDNNSMSAFPPTTQEVIVIV